MGRTDVTIYGEGIYPGEKVENKGQGEYRRAWTSTLVVHLTLEHRRGRVDIYIEEEGILLPSSSLHIKPSLIISYHETTASASLEVKLNTPSTSFAKNRSHYHYNV